VDIKTLQSILRIFFRYETSALLYVHGEAIQGIIKKDDIEGLMSDLSFVKDEHSIPLTRVNSIDEILEIHQEYAVYSDDSLILPVINEHLDLIGKWSRTDLIKKWDNVENRKRESNFDNKSSKPSIIVTSNKRAIESKENRFGTSVKKVGENRKTGINVISQANRVAEPDRDNEIKIIQNSKKSIEKNERVESASEGKGKRVIDQPANLSIQALEALPIPMMAIDTKGKVLFFNQDWEIMQDKESKLEAVSLMNYAKDEMAKLAFEGKLTIHSTLEFTSIYPGKIIKMKSLLSDQTANTDKKHESRPLATGYIFWVINDSINTKEDSELSVNVGGQNKSKGFLENDHAKQVSAQNSTTGEDQKEEYSGRTLNDILANEEKKVLAWAMQKAGKNQSHAATILGIPRQTFAYRYKKYFSN